jgi:hypothetical protein
MVLKRVAVASIIENSHSSLSLIIATDPVLNNIKRNGYASHTPKLFLKYFLY